MAAPKPNSRARTQVVQPTTLPAKLLAIAKAINPVPKKGENTTQHYSYVEAEDVLKLIRAKLLDAGILVRPELTNDTYISHFSETGGKSFVTTFVMAYTFVDTETGEEWRVAIPAAGADIGGDKGVYKALTGSFKYALIQTFLIITGDDPEADRVSEETEQQTATKDERKAAPTIPVARAKKILDKAIKVSHAKKTGNKVTLSAALKAKLADAGSDTGKISQLNVDQAEDVEAWLESEA